MAAAAIREKRIDCIVVGADRVTANGDTANKIGTYQLAIIGAYHKIPFLVASPTTTLDMKLKSGKVGSIAFITFDALASSVCIYRGL